MYSLSNQITRKFIDTVDIKNLEIETDSGWKPITKIVKTVPYTVWTLVTKSGLVLNCADTHIIYDENYNEIFVKDVKPLSFIQTKDGLDQVQSITKHKFAESMYDLTVNSDEHRYYTNNILSHNTVIVNALSYALYGQALTNIKRDNLINNINGKNMLVALSFSKDNVDYRIERGRKPSILKFFVNDVEQATTEHDDSQGDSRETQRDLTSLLGMSHDMFKHIVALNTYTEPFLSMRAADQRAIIEQLLGITLLSEKAENLKEQIRITKEDIVKETANIESIKKSNEKIQQSINTLLARQKTWQDQHQLQLERLAKSIVELENIDIENELKQHELLKEYQSQQLKITNLQKEQTILKNALVQSEKTIKKCNDDLTLLQDKKCHTCGQMLHDDKHQEITNSKQKQLDDAVAYYQEIEEKLNKTINEINSFNKIAKPNTFYDTIEEALRHQNNLNVLEEQLLVKANETDSYQEQIDELRNTALQSIEWEKVNELDQIRNHQEFLLKLLTNKDSFIRKKIINQNLSYLNSRLTYYLDRINLPHIVTFQNDLTVNITQLGKDLDFDNLSRGERNRLIISLSFAFRDLWENLQSSINLLFIDEILDAGLDSSGVENSLAILKQIARDRKKNIFLISHKDELIGRVNSVFKVIKTGGFTTFENDIEISA